MSIKTTLKLFFLFFILNVLNISIIKIIIIVYIISFLKFKSLIFVKYSVFSKLVGKKLIFERWRILQNGFLEKNISILKNLGLIRPYQQFKSTQNDSFQNEYNNLASDLEISFKLLNKAIQQQKSQETYNQNLRNDWDNIKIWVNKNSSIDELIQKINLINNGKDNEGDIEEQLQNFIEKNNKTELNLRVKQFKDSLNEPDAKLFIQKLLNNSELTLPNELDDQQIIVANNLKKKNLDIEIKHKKNKKIKNNELDERNETFFKRKRSVEEEESKNQGIKNESEFFNSGESELLDSISFFSQKKNVHNDNFVSNNFFSVHDLRRKPNIKKNNSTSQYSNQNKHKDYVSEVNLFVESFSVAKNSQSSNNLNALIEDFKDQIVLKKCNSEDNLLNEKNYNKTCNIYIGEYDSKEKCSVYSKQQLNFGSNLFENKCVQIFNTHPKIAALKKLNEDESISTFYNLTRNPFNEKLLDKDYTDAFVKVEVFSAVLTNSNQNKPNQSSLVLSNFDSQNKQTLPLLNNDSESNKFSSIMKPVKLSLHKQFFIKKQTLGYWFKEKGIESVESILKTDSIGQLYRKTNLKNHFLLFNKEFRGDLEMRLKTWEENFAEENEIAKEFMHNLADLDQLSDATAYIHWAVVSEFFLQNKEVSANELCNCNSIDLMQFNRLASTANNAKFINNYFEKEFNRILTNVLGKESYKNTGYEEKKMMELNFAVYTYVRISRAENFICKENNFSEIDIKSHGVSNLPLHYFMTKHIINNPAYLSLTSDEFANKDFSGNLSDSGSVKNMAILKILDAMGQGPAGL